MPRFKILLLCILVVGFVITLNVGVLSIGAQTSVIGGGSGGGTGPTGPTGSTAAGGSVLTYSGDHTLASGDNGNWLKFTSGTLTVASPPILSSFTFIFQNLTGSSQSISRNGLTINGLSADYVVADTLTAACYTDGTNYFCTKGAGGPAGTTGATGPQGNTGSGGGSSSFFPGDGTNTSATAGNAPVFAVTSPPSTGWTTVNAGSSTIDSTGGFEYLDSVVGVGATTNLILRVRTAPSTPYTITAAFLPDTTIAGNISTAGWGLAFRDGGGKLVTLRTNQNGGGAAPAMDFDKWDSATTFNADYTATTLPINLSVTGGIFWRRIQDDGTNLKVWTSNDGQHWTQYGGSHVRGDFLSTGPTQVGFFVYNQGRVAVSLLSWVAQ